jgi:hypothetical protein
VTDLKDGPHVVIDHKTDPWPGLQIKVFKDGHQVPCCIELDSRRRTYKRLGLLLLDIPEDEFFDRVELGDGGVQMKMDENNVWVGTVFDHNPQPTLVDGKPWDPWENIVEESYDTVVAIGHWEAVDRWRSELPKHWAVLTHFHSPRPLPEGVVWQNPDIDWMGEPPNPGTLRHTHWRELDHEPGDNP